ncbi:MAG: CvpA family protein [Betaproteobacteria bacterium]|nr:CvpA family protein [Betaproteobacteria bacterium]
MNGVDFLVLGIVILSVAVGAYRGAMREVLHLAGWVLAFILSSSFAGSVAPYFSDWMSEPAFRVAMAWVTIFLGVLMLASLLASLLTELLRRFGLDGLNRAAGGAIGLARAGLVVLVFTWLAGMTKFPQSVWWRNSAAAPWLEHVAMSLKTFLPEGLAARISYRADPGLKPAVRGA